MTSAGAAGTGTLGARRPWAAGAAIAAGAASLALGLAAGIAWAPTDTAMLR